VTLLELLAATAWTGVVASWQPVLHDGRAGLLGAGVVLCGGTLVGVGQLFLVDILLRLRVLLAWGGLFRGCLLHLLYDGNLGTGED